jgi:heme-degrading monooxygenase HmoA
MFILIARYKVKEEHQKKFVEESHKYYSDKFKGFNGFLSVKYLKNILDKQFIDIITEWKTKEDFLGFIKKYQKKGVIKFSVPVEVCERYLYEAV